ncbi:hypothetical protein LLH23_15985 [bacterium]|nr:hypothetical protein [bacterium]
MRLAAWAALIVGAASLLHAQDLRAGNTLLADSFDRFTSATADLGKLPGTERPWVKRIPALDGKPAEGLITAARGAVTIGYSSGSNPCDTGLAVDGFTVADGVVSLTVGPSQMAGRGHTAIVSYRAADVQAAAGGMADGAYHVEVAPDWSGSRDVILRYGKERLAVADITAARGLQDPHRVRVAFSGDHHQVWLDDKLVMDFWEAASDRTAAGHVGFGGYYSIGTFDDFSVAEVVGGPTSAADTKGQLRPLLFQGRPFFVLGTYDAPRDGDLAEWLEAGCNTTLFHVADPKTTPAQRREQIEKDIAWARPHNTALIYFPAIDFYARTNGKPTVPTPDQTAPMVAQLQEMLAITGRDRQTFGYCTFDEPENVLHPAYADWEKRKDVGLGEWIGSGFKWLYDTLKAGDPDAYVMPIIAWWTTYEATAPIYDVNLPDEYPQRGAPLSGDLFNAVYDAAKAADAARAKGRTGFVYMPPCFDVIEAPWRAATVAEFRYLCFGPLTQGAQGLLTWRLGRATLPYRRAVIYPVYRQIKPLIPWLLGERCDERVTSDADAPTVDYLKKLPVRVRTVAGETIEKVEVAGVSDCSHCLRRRPDNTYLLLAVNNRREPLTVTFTLQGLGDLPETALETLQYARTPLSGGQIRETFEPFGVRAWVIEPK